MEILTHARLKEFLEYDSDTGKFTWKNKRSNRTHSDLSAGCCTSHRNVLIGIFGKIYQAHRLAWFWSYGEWPSLCIDHIDGNPQNNKLSNLRNVSASINMQNRKKPTSRNKHGLLGVVKRGNRWIAELRHQGKTKYLGSFDTKKMHTLNI